MGLQEVKASGNSKEIQIQVVNFVDKVEIRPSSLVSIFDYRHFLNTTFEKRISFRRCPFIHL